MNPQETQYRARGIYGPGILLFEVAVILQIFVFLALAVRLYSRRITRCGVDVDDWIITGAVVSHS